jgi:hypothetical protein
VIVNDRPVRAPAAANGAFRAAGPAVGSGAGDSIGVATVVVVTVGVVSATVVVVVSAGTLGSGAVGAGTVISVVVVASVVVDVGTVVGVGSDGRSSAAAWPLAGPTAADSAKPAATRAARP